MNSNKTQYHVNPMTGQAHPCNARKQPCRFGGLSGLENHYDSLQDARDAFEYSMNQNKFANSPLVKTNAFNSSTISKNGEERNNNNNNSSSNNNSNIKQENLPVNLTVENNNAIEIESNNIRKTTTPAKQKELRAESQVQGVRKEKIAAKYSKLSEGFSSASGFANVPTEVQQELANFLSVQQFNSVAVVPVGSILYNSQLPNRVNHDYDFYVIADGPGLSNSKKINQVMRGDLDINIVDVKNIARLVDDSTALSETMFALNCRGSEFYVDNSDPWQSFVLDFKPSEHKYFFLTNRSADSHRMRYVSPVLPGDEKSLRSFKHVVRWNIYRSRWGSGQPMDPVLSDREREIYLKVLESGELETLADYL